jgi:hypothetical protein
MAPDKLLVFFVLSLTCANDRQAAPVNKKSRIDTLFFMHKNTLAGILPSNKNQTDA